MSSLELPREIVELASLKEIVDFSETDGIGLKDDEQDQVHEIGNRDIDHTWLMHPLRVERYRTLYMEMYEKANEDQKKIIVRAMEAFAGSKEAFGEMRWCCLIWAAGGAAMMTAYPSFKRYLESVVSESLQKKSDSIRGLSSA